MNSHGQLRLLRAETLSLVLLRGDRGPLGGRVIPLRDCLPPAGACSHGQEQAVQPSTAPTPGSQPYSAPILRSLEFMHRSFRASALSLSRLAYEACLSPCYYCRRFRSEVGTTPTRYLAGLRVEEAGRLLRDTRLSVTEVCHMSGFGDLTHFERVFKSLLGETPSRFRDHYAQRPHPGKEGEHHAEPLASAHA